MMSGASRASSTTATEKQSLQDIFNLSGVLFGLHHANTKLSTIAIRKASQIHRGNGAQGVRA